MPERSDPSPEESILRIPVDQLGDTEYKGEFEVVKEPTEFDRVAAAIAALSRDQRDIDVMREMIKDQTFARYAMPLLLGKEYAHSLTNENIADGRRLTNFAADHLKFEIRLDDIRARFSKGLGLTWPLPVLKAPIRAHIPQDLRRQTMAIVGDGPAGLLMARMRAALGYNRGTTVLFSPSNEPGGIWNHDRVVNEGHNTFATAKAFANVLSADGDRPGKELQEFLRGIADASVRGMHRKAKVEEIRFDAASGKYLVSTGDHEESVDSVFVASGNAMPRNLASASAPMQTNLPQQERFTAIKRWQEQIPKEKWNEYVGKNPVVVGLGNSAMAMIGEFQKMQAEGVDVNPVILTHHSRHALRNPNKIVMDRDLLPEGPIFRTRSNLSRVAGDIDKIRQRFEKALYDGWIIPDVRRWDVGYSGEKKKENLFVEATQYRGHRSWIPNVNMIYALVGYQNNPEVMKQFGCKVLDEEGRVDIDPLTHTVRPVVPDAGRMYIAGNAASQKNDRNQEVIPGIMRIVGEIAFAEVIKGHRSVPSTPQEIDSTPKRIAEVPDVPRIEIYSPAEVLAISASIRDRILETLRNIR